MLHRSPVVRAMEEVTILCECQGDDDDAVVSLDWRAICASAPRANRTPAGLHRIIAVLRAQVPPPNPILIGE
ncbi:MAG: hypothetical protein M3003_08185 [Candidatus Dormibacteraeota bacterium]|nr:hypothetical protein [Candidatus Dormibacteraeota bacterium]